MKRKYRSNLFAVAVSIVIAAVLLMSVYSSDSVAKTTFDHFTTGFRLEGAHRFAECESCHNDGSFAGTPTKCVECHAQASRSRATWRPPTHLPVTDSCDSCHRPNAWSPVLRFDHLEAFGSCSSCHNNVTARGQHPQHVVTTSECDSCHNTRFWR